MNEFERIDVFVKHFSKLPPSPFGPGDDAAVIPPARDVSCVTTDAVVEGVHFSRPAFSLEDVGHKALAVNLSDLAAMGAVPTWAVCALALPPELTGRDVSALGKGMARLARKHGVTLVGGNITRAPALSVTLTVSGRIPRGRTPLLRSGAKAGHRLYLSGPVGDSSAGLDVLRRSGPRNANERALANAQRRPSPHLAWSLAAAPFVSAAIDVSDGLAQDLGHLCAASGVGAALDELPLSSPLLAWAESRFIAERYALTGGEDYVVLATVAPRRVEAFEAAMQRCGFSVHPIGVTTRARTVTFRGQRLDTTSGHRHFH